MYRDLFLRGYIDENNTGEVIEKIVELNRDDNDSEILRKDREPIRLHIQSEGGNIMDGFALVDIILTSKTPVYTYCEGYAESSALDIFLAGEKRFAFTHSRFLIHSASATMTDMPLPNVERHLVRLRDLEELGKELLIKRTKLTREQVEELYSTNNDNFFGVTEAIEYGIVTDFIEWGDKNDSK